MEDGHISLSIAVIAGIIAIAALFIYILSGIIISYQEKSF